MKKLTLVCIIVLLITLMLMLLQSCDKNDPDTGDTKDSENSIDMPPSYYSEKYKDMYSDDTVYNTNLYTGYSIYLRRSKGNVSNQNIYEVLLDHPGEAMYAHEDPTCSHDTASCPMSSEGISTRILVVSPEYRKTPLVYFFCRYAKTVYVDGKEEPAHAVYTEVREYDTETGEVRTLAETPFNYIENTWCYKGKLYFWAKWCYGSATEQVGMIDLATGKFSFIDSTDDLRIIGIANDRVWCMIWDTSSGKSTIGSCSLDLSDLRDEYDIGVTTKRLALNTLTAYAEDGIIYFERNCRVAPGIEENSYLSRSYYMISDVYMLKTDDLASGETLVAEGVYLFKPESGDLYYSKIDYEEFGTACLDGNREHTITVCTFDRGTFYKYDHDTCETNVCFSDIGVGIDEIYEITDDKMIFQGRRYRDLESCARWDGKDLYSIIDIKTGEWHVLYSYDPEE